MSFWTLLQILVDLSLLAGGALLWVKLNRPAKDDPRLSKGLQLLQSKIAVLEDLSDRTETQVSQLTAILETKCREIQDKIAAADRQIARIDASAAKSLEVAKIFQDRIPHSEILERQNTIKYVTAARLAHQGRTIDEIAAQVDLSLAEIEFIAKVNREQLQFSEDDLPEWARATNLETANAVGNADVRFSLPRENFQARETMPTPQAHGGGFAPSPAPTSFSAARAQMPATPPAVQTFMEIDLRAPAVPTPATPPVTTQAQTSSGKTVQIRPVLFPRIDTDRSAE